MACTSGANLKGMTLERRMAQFKAALKRLETYLQTGSVRIAIAPNGAIAFAGWKDRDDVVDACAFRALQAEGSSVLRMVLARAEAQQGRRVNMNAVAAGYHSHDGGKTWGTHSHSH